MREYTAEFTFQADDGDVWWATEQVTARTRNQAKAKAESIAVGELAWKDENGLRLLTDEVEQILPDEVTVDVD